MFSFAKVKKTVTTAPPPQDTKIEIAEVEHVEQKPEPEWVEVEGYKGLTPQMQEYGNFQFELGKTYKAENEVKACKNGFHFCLNLQDVQSYYPWEQGSRYFKVKALVLKQDLDSYGSVITHFGSFKTVDKLAAAELTLIEELSPEEIYTQLKDSIFFSKEQFIDFLNSSYTCEQFILNNFLTSLKGMYSDTFIMCISNQVRHKAESSKVGYQPNLNYLCTLVEQLSETKTKMIGLYEENVSSDMRAYLLLTTRG